VCGRAGGGGPAGRPLGTSQTEGGESGGGYKQEAGGWATRKRREGINKEGQCLWYLSSGESRQRGRQAQRSRRAWIVWGGEGPGGEGKGWLTAEDVVECRTKLSMRERQSCWARHGSEQPTRPPPRSWHQPWVGARAREACRGGQRTRRGTEGRGDGRGPQYLCHGSVLRRLLLLSRTILLHFVESRVTSIKNIYFALSNIQYSPYDVYSIRLLQLATIQPPPA